MQEYYNVYLQASDRMQEFTIKLNIPCLQEAVGRVLWIFFVNLYYNMWQMEKRIEIIIEEFKELSELGAEDRQLVEKSMEASHNAYSPYSGFSVGAALRLDSGEIITGNNRENAAFPSGICAERTAISYAGANFPQSKIITLAISAHNSRGFTTEPVSPCGTCRQVIAEEEDRNKQAIRILLFGTEKIQVINGNKNLLPLHFSSSKFI